MALVDLLFKTRVRLGINANEEFLPYGAVELDASIDETHTAENDITQFPVEEGVDISDHVRKQPNRLTIRGIVTDHPIVGISRGVGVIAPTLTSGRSLDAYQRLLTMLEEAQRISVVTSLRQYENMVIESMEVPRNAQRGHAVEMFLQLREIKTASLVAIAGTTNLGTQNTALVA